MCDFAFALMIPLRLHQSYTVVHFVVLWRVAVYCVVAVESIGRQIPYAFLERIKHDFNQRYSGGKAATALPGSLNREFGWVILLWIDVILEKS